MRVLAEADSVSEAIPEILRRVCEALGWDYGALWTLQDDELRCVDLWTCDPLRISDFARISRESRFSRGVGVPGVVWQAGEPVWIRDIVTSETLPRAPFAANADLHAAFGVPLFVRNKFYGVLEFFSHDIHEPDDALIAMLADIGRHVGGFIEWDEMERELVFQRAILEYQSEAALDAIGVLAPDMRILYWNQRAVDMLGLSEEALRSGDGAALVAGLVQMTDEPARMAELAQTVFSDPDASLRLEAPLADGRVLDVWTAPVRGPDGRLYGRVINARDITDRKRVEDTLRREEEWAAFFAEATAMLSESLDVDTVLHRLAHKVVPELADWCTVQLGDESGQIEQIVIAHVDPAKVELAKRIRDEYPPDPRVDVGVHGVIRSREPLLMSEIPPELIEQSAQDEQHRRLLRELQLRSVMIVPLICRGRVLGAITFIASESGRTYDETDLKRAKELASRAAYPIDNARLYEETRRIAQTLQKSFLPPDLPDIPGVDIAARYFPAGEGEMIGGDFYDAFRIDGRRFGLVLGDVSGKGLEAATVTSLARHTIRGAALTATTPSEALSILNQAMLDQNQTDRFCTAVYAIVDPKFGRIRVSISSGGHPCPYVIRNDGSIESVECGGTLLGFIEAIALRDATVDLEFGDKLFLYTDGVLDIRQKDGTFGPEGLEKLLYESSKRGTEAAADYISTALAEIQDGRITDDIAFILMGVRSSVFNIQSRRVSRRTADTG
jgi:PAS domain S-box-containing protein